VTETKVVTVKLFFHVRSGVNGSVNLVWFSTKALRDAYQEQAFADIDCEDPTVHPGEAEFRIDPATGEILSDPCFNNVNPEYW
jgi:hypothetical protein